MISPILKTLFQTKLTLIDQVTSQLPSDVQVVVKQVEQEVLETLITTAQEYLERSNNQDTMKASSTQTSKSMTHIPID